MPKDETGSGQKCQVAAWSELEDRKPAYALVANVDLVVVRFDDRVSVLYGRCQHRGALMSDGDIDGDNLICGLHGWDYKCETGVSEYNNAEKLHKFTAWIDVDTDSVYVNEDEVRAWENDHPKPYQRNAYQGLYADPSGTGDEPHTKYIRKRNSPLYETDLGRMGGDAVQIQA